MKIKRHVQLRTNFVKSGGNKTIGNDKEAIKSGGSESNNETTVRGYI